jgi:20S proteasome subunit beta 3
MEYSGSGIVAMCGKDCVAIASDTRFGAQQQTIASNMKRIYQFQDKVFMGMAGLISDLQTFSAKLKFRLKLYELREDRQMKPKVFANLVSTMLYEKRFGPWFVEPVVAGLDEKDQPYICAMDLIGAPVFTDDFVVGGTSGEELYGVCEALYKPNLEPDELFEVISQSLLAAVDRDCLAGWGAEVHIIDKKGVTTRKLKSRLD